MDEAADAVVVVIVVLPAVVVVVVGLNLREMIGVGASMILRTISGVLGRLQPKEGVADGRKEEKKLASAFSFIR